MKVGPVLRSEVNIICSRKQREPLTGFKLKTDRVGVRHVNTLEENNLFKFLMRRILNQKSIAMIDSILLHVFTLAIESVFRLSITP